MTLSTYITNEEIAVLVVYLVSLTGGLIWALYRIYVLEKREKLWREVCEATMKLAYLEARSDKGVGVYEKDRLKDKINELKQQLGYDKNQTS